MKPRPPSRLPPLPRAQSLRVPPATATRTKLVKKWSPQVDFGQKVSNFTIAFFDATAAAASTYAKIARPNPQKEKFPNPPHRPLEGR